MPIKAMARITESVNVTAAQNLEYFILKLRVDRPSIIAPKPSTDRMMTF